MFEHPKFCSRLEWPQSSDKNCLFSFAAAHKFEKLDRCIKIKNMTGSGTAQQAFEWGGGGLNWTKFFLGGDAWEFLFNFSKVTENAFIPIKLLIFLHIFSDVAIGSTDINL